MNIAKPSLVIFFSLSIFLGSAFADTPTIPTAIKSDKKNIPVADLNTGDTITIVFSEPTNESLKQQTGNNLAKADVDSLFSFSTPIGTDYTGRWLNPILFEITIQDPGAVVANDLLGLVITAKASGGIKDAAQTSAASTASQIFFVGDFDTHGGPTIVSLVADDPDSGDTIYSTGDTITLRFSEATNEPLKGLNNQIAKTDVDKLFLFGDGNVVVNLGNDYSGTWKNPSTFVITIDDATGASPTPAVGSLNTTLIAKLNGISLKNAAGTSSDADLFGTGTLNGDFGGFKESFLLAAGGRAISTLPSGTLTIFEPPPTIVDTITISRSAASPDVSTGTATFVGDVIEIESTSATTCSDECKFTFLVSENDLAEAGVESSSLKMLHDRNDDGDFNDEGEILNTDVLSGLLAGTFLVNAVDDKISKFAIGGVPGVRANVAAAAQSLSKGGFFDPISSCEPDGFASGQSLRVYEIRYDKCDENKLQVITYSTCGPIVAEVATDRGRYILGISSNQPYLNDKEKKIVFGADISPELESFNIVIKDKRDSFTDRIFLNKCSATKSYSYTTGYTSEQQGHVVESMEQNLQEPQIPSWVKTNARWWSEGQIGDTEFTQGIEYLIQQDMIDVRESTKAEDTQQQIPTWVKTNSQWWADGVISDSEFIKGLEYLIKIGIIRV